MPDFFLEPDEIEPERPARRPVHLVSGGLHPTEAVPLSSQKGPEHPPVAGPCPHCAQPVLHGETNDGTRVCLDLGVASYTVLWVPGAQRPRVTLSRGYPTHRCGGAVQEGATP